MGDNLNLEQELKQVIANITGIPEDKIVGKANFVDDLGIESIVAVDIIAEIERKYAVEIPEEKYGEFDCIDSAVEIVGDIIKNKTQG